jgi:hypothetical protein
MPIDHIREIIPAGKVVRQLVQEALACIDGFGERIKNKE